MFGEQSHRTIVLGEVKVDYLKLDRYPTKKSTLQISILFNKRKGEHCKY